MAYIKRHRPQIALGAFTSQSQCASIPTGDPYRVPGHQCVQNGALVTFNPDGSVQTGASVDLTTYTPPPAPTAAPPSGSSSSMMSYLIIGGLAAVGLFAFSKLRKKKQVT